VGNVKNRGIQCPEIEMIVKCRIELWERKYLSLRLNHVYLVNRHKSCFIFVVYN